MGDIKKQLTIKSATLTYHELQWKTIIKSMDHINIFELLISSKKSTLSSITLLSITNQHLIYHPLQGQQPQIHLIEDAFQHLQCQN